MPASSDSSLSTLPKVKVSVVSDTMCPFCWVGKRHLEAAATQLSSTVQLDVEWHPFMLNSRLPKDGMKITEYFEMTYGSAAHLDRAHANLKNAGNKVGINFQFSKDRLVTPTLDSHRVIELAKEQGKQDEMVERLFKMYMEEGKALGSAENLIHAANDVSVTGVAELLESDRFKDSVSTEAQRWSQSGVSGVPFFIFEADGSDKRFAVSGALPTDQMVTAIERALSDAEKEKEKVQLAGAGAKCTGSECTI
jgi:predicted DsbA family dithiol-disulfide isomerase